MTVALEWDSIRVRLVALFGAVLIPLAGVAMVVTLLDVRDPADGALMLARQGLTVAVARHEAAVAAARATLRALAATPDVANATASCAAILSAVVKVEAPRLIALAVLDPGGGLRCGTVVPAADHRPAIEVPAIEVTDRLAAGELRAGFQADPPAPVDRLHGWLLAGGRPVGANKDAGTLPVPASLAALASLSSGTRLAPSAAGPMAAYAVREVSPGLRLLTGVLVSDVASPASPVPSVLAIAALMVAALSLMMLGVERIVVLPLRRLDSAVRRWRGGAAADAGELDAMPRELRELTLSFAQATSALNAREGELRGALAQQELLMQEIHHRVKNNLQIVASLLNLQASRIRQPEARAEFQSARDRVRALATLHRHLYGHGELHTINMREFLNELCVQLFQGFHEEVGERIELAIDATELQMSSDQAVPIALIVTETVSNALKFAFPDGARGRIRVALDAAGELARLVIEDDGVGLPSDSADATHQGIGLQLIRGFARQLGATLSVTEAHGTRYEIEMRVVQVRPLPEAGSPAKDAADSHGPQRDLQVSGETTSSS